VVVAGTASGVGKTTVATGLMAALRSRGSVVAAAKVGPDYIDPGYHSLATGRPGRNLDAWMCGPEAVAPLAALASDGADVLVVEGVMGLFDGAADDGWTASTAHVATLLDAPVILVVDAASMSGSVAALVHGYATFDARVRVAGVILNRVGSDAHEAMLRQALAPLDIGVLGVLRRDETLSWRDRHLGLVPVVEKRNETEQSLDRLAAAMGAACDLDAVMRLAASAPERRVARLPEPRVSGRARVAVASGPAFSFVYPDNLEALEQAGAELVAFDPVNDGALPEACTGLYAGGGFPEIFAESLAANRPLLDEVRRRVAGGLVTWAECGGLLWLSRSLDGRPLAGAIDTDATMTDQLTLGYRQARVRADNPVAPLGAVLRGHEFHYSFTAPSGDVLELGSRFDSNVSGFASPTILASYLHLHLGAAPAVAERFVAAAC
jgi:cobyrinic acid a,c-diamide synthase